MAIYDDVNINVTQYIAETYKLLLDDGEIAEDTTEDEVIDYLYDIISDEYFGEEHWNFYTDQYRSIEAQMQAYDAIKDDFGTLDYLYNKDSYGAQSEYEYGYIGMYIVLYKYYLDQNLSYIVDTFVSSQY